MEDNEWYVEYLGMKEAYLKSQTKLEIAEARIKELEECIHATLKLADTMDY